MPTHLARAGRLLVAAALLATALYGLLRWERAADHPARTPHDPGERLALRLDGAHARGAEAPLVTLIWFGDYGDPLSRAAAGAITDLRARHGAQLRELYRHAPLLTGSQGLDLAVAAEAAGSLGAFWELHDALYGTPLAELPALSALAQRVGLEPERFSAAHGGAAALANIHRDLAEARRVGVQLPPAAFLNGRRLTGPLSPAALEAAAQGALAEAQRLRDRGVPASEIWETLQVGARGDAGGVLPAAPLTRHPLPLPEGLLASGPADAPVQALLVTGACGPFCAAAEELVGRLAAAHPRQLRAWRVLVDQPDLPASRDAALCFYHGLSVEPGAALAAYRALVAGAPGAPPGCGAAPSPAAAVLLERARALRRQAPSPWLPALYLNGIELATTRPDAVYASIIAQEAALAESLARPGLSAGDRYQELLRQPASQY